MIRPPGTSERADLPLAVVIGAGALGSALARRLGADHRLLLADRDIEKAEGLAAALRSEGHDAKAHCCDITDPASLEALTQAAGEWRALAHVAALSPSMAGFTTILEVNLVGTLHVEAAFQRTARAGSVAIFISSLGAHSAPPPAEVLAQLDQGLTPGLVQAIETLTPDPTTRRAYQISKFAMNRMCRRRASAWGQRGARILSLSPGLIATPMGALEFKGTPGKRELYEQTPLAREGTMVEIAAMAGFLASPAASFVSGVDILVDGGLAAAVEFSGPAKP